MVNVQRFGMYIYIYIYISISFSQLHATMIADPSDICKASLSSCKGRLTSRLCMLERRRSRCGCSEDARECRMSFYAAFLPRILEQV